MPLRDYEDEVRDPETPRALPKPRKRRRPIFRLIFLGVVTAVGVMLWLMSQS